MAQRKCDGVGREEQPPEKEKGAPKCALKKRAVRLPLLLQSLGRGGDSRIGSTKAL